MSIWQKELPDGTWLIGVQGRLDQSQNLQLEKNLTNLLDEGNSRFIVDLQETTYINSGGLRCLVSVWRKAHQREGNLVLCGLNPRLREIFSMVGFDKVFQIHSDCEAAQQQT